MPSSFSSTFASAAAGNANNEAGPNGRGAGRADGSGDWSRARTNGATQTFRRPSLGTNLSNQKDANTASSPSALPGSGVYVPPHLNSNFQSSFGRNGGIADSRYSKNQLLDLFRAQVKPDQANSNVADYFVDGWNPDSTSSASNGTWAKKEEPKDGSGGPEICWDYEGVSHPLGLIEMGEDEREVFTSSVNSPLKGPSQNTTKEATPNSATVGRRTSLSHAQSLIGTYSGNSPTARPSTRRRESSDIVSANSLTSPIGNSRFSKEDFNVSSPPPSLLRRRTDYKENASGSGLDDRDEENLKPGSVVDPVVSFGPLKRTSTGPAGTGVNGPSSPWSATPQSAGFSPMGAFGNFSLGGPSSGQAFSPTDKKPTIGSFRGESRFKGLMNTENSEETTKVKEKASSTNLEKLTEVNNEQTFANWPAGSVRHRRSDEKYGTGSAALGGDDASPPTQHSSRAKTAENQSPYDGIGFSSLGLSSDVTNLREVVPRRDYSQSIMTNQTQNYLPSNEPMSPTSTNPFQSPEGEKAIHEDFETDESELHSTHFVNTRPFSQHARGIQTQHEGTASDRSQTSSVGAPRSYPNLGALGALSGMSGAGAWSAGPGAIGTPTRTLSGHPGGFGETVFHPLSDFTSPAHMNASVLGTGPSGGIPPIALGSAGPIGRGSKMGSLFPSAMQDQMRGDSARQESGFGDGNELYQRNLGNLNAPGFVSGLQDTENSIRSGRGTLDDLFGNLDLRNRHAQGASATFGGNDNVQTSSGPIPTSMLSQQPFPATSTFIGSPTMAVSSSGSYFSRAQDQDTTAALSNQMPALQQRKMVMPDRMRWIYRDPQGNTQGPWSGLEMHDWYKAGFFSPELQVKKLEDADYEPLAQLIRRIGNSREPFLVPQIGIPHGSVAIAPGVNVSASGALSASTPSALQTSAAQPPFPSSFPSFGTTLTAEQQNALERRKQEEQYLMARQKEHLAQQQNLMKQMQHMQSGSHGLHGQQLHHHSSAHSLQSQPSYGSITSPTGYQPTPTQGPIQMPPAIPGFFDSRNMPSNLGPLGGGSEALGPVREDEVTGIIDRLNTGRGGQVSFGGPPYHPGQPEGLSHSQQVAAMLQERARLQHEQEQYDLLKRSADNQGNSERLEQFHMLRSQVDEQPQQHSQSSFVGGHMGRPVAETDNSNQQQKKETAVEPPKQIQSLPPPPPKAVERPSLSEQVQKAAALAKQSPNAPPPQSPWAKVDIGLPQPFPPPQSSSPLPAPAAQRNRHNVAETLSAESRSQSQTPSVETPNTAIAPWAKDLTDPSKGPSLKEIQAIEARKAAQQEEIAAATRRAAAEQERQNQVQPAAPTPGLPSSANWASGVSPAVPMTPGVSAWTKPVAGKAPTVPASTSTKKTLAQIQKEEEARKTRAAAASAAANAASNSSNLLAMAGGKRYADLASKSTLTTQGGNSAWTTVGAGGKVKTPAGPAPNVSNRSLGTTTQPTLAPAKPKVTAPTRGGVVGSVSNQQLAADEFQKWTKSALGKGLNTGIPVDDFVSQLLMLPPEPDIISDSIYASSQILDGRRFAEEFVRRRKLADKGIVPDSGTIGIGGGGFMTPGENKSASGAGGGWNEVAKKASSSGHGGGGAAGDGVRGESFMVVKGKRKGKK